jgi:hypothetical protein
MKVPPYVVHVKYKTTTYSGIDAGTPKHAEIVASTSIFMGFSCGKLGERAWIAGLLTARERAFSD